METTGTENTNEIRRRGRPRTRPLEKKYATIEDVDKLSDTIQKLADSVYTLIDTKKNDTQTLNSDVEKIIEAEKKDKAQMSPRYNDLIDKILGQDFKREMFYPVHGFPKIIITVPDDKSNMKDDYRKFYKIDKRTIVILNGIDSLLTGLRKIRQNLKRRKDDSLTL